MKQNAKATRKTPPQRGARDVKDARDATDEARELFQETVDRQGNILRGARVYLSGPMDFVASRQEEKRNGWRNRVAQVLRGYGVTVYDPWNKPAVLGLREYGKEDEFTAQGREHWTFDNSAEGDAIRARVCGQFWPTLHIDLRMVDTSDFLIAYCPTNVYSVGTAHEIAMARQQHKPVLLVSPPVTFPALEELRRHLRKAGDGTGQELLEQLTGEVPIHDNAKGTPSLWYLAMLDGGYFFDGFGFAEYLERFPAWTRGPLDEREKRQPPARPLLPFLEKLNDALPRRYDLARGQYVVNDDWLILESQDFL